MVAVQHKKQHISAASGASGAAADVSLSLSGSAFAGFIGTVPMTVFMLVTQQFLPKGQQYELPPELIIKELANKAHVQYKMSKTQILIATLISHLGYGTSMGLLYSPVEKKIPLPSVVKGILFGLVVWASSYIALLPLMRMSESAHNEPVRRNLLMIAAHVVWGATLGVVADLLTP